MHQKLSNLAGHDKFYTASILKIYDIIFSKKPELDSVSVFRVKNEFLEFSVVKDTESDQNKAIKSSKNFCCMNKQREKLSG